MSRFVWVGAMMGYRGKATNLAVVDNNAIPSQQKSVDVRSPRGGRGSIPAMKNVVEISRSDLSNLICAAFDELAEKNGTVVKDFRQAFETRTQSTELAEWGGGIRSLTKTLGVLLRRVPPDSYFRRRYPRDSYRDTEFHSEFRKAIAMLVRTDAEALEGFEDHVRQAKLDRVEALRALLARYAKNRDVYPY